MKKGTLRGCLFLFAAYKNFIDEIKEAHIRALIDRVRYHLPKDPSFSKGVLHTYIPLFLLT